MIRIYNTLSKNKEAFVPVREGQVGIYLCGPTVYKPSHIGHMVGPVIFDTIKRYLAYCGFQVTFVINITDVDDKLIAEANRRKMSMDDVAREMIDDYMRNLDAMGIDSVDAFPKATDHIETIIEFTRDLIEKGYAYESEGDVYFQVSKLDDYGKLSHRSLDELQGEGGDAAGRKKSVFDFALWKSAKAGEPAWKSPWGPGRPGWHIECSAMSRSLLGETFDIHGGGLDLVFPHHENEIAQSEARHGHPMAKYWLHNGLMQASDEVGKVGGRRTRAAEEDVEGQEVGKISKSKGARPFGELLEQFAPETIRFFLLSTHYRRPIDFSTQRIGEVATGLETFYRFFKRYQRVTGQSFYYIKAPQQRQTEASPPADNPLRALAHAKRTAFLEMMDDDFNTGGAIGELFELVRALNKYIDDHKLEIASQGQDEAIAALTDGTRIFRELSLTLGLFRKPPTETANGADSELTGKLLDLLVSLRTEARKSKDFATADRIRDELTAMGVALEDRPDGTEWTIP